MAPRPIAEDANNAGIINWYADTWTVRPAGNIQYVNTWHRTIFTLSSDYTYYHTESFHTSTSLLKINGDSEVWENKIDVDIPLGKMLWGHELRTGGYFSRSSFSTTSRAVWALTTCMKSMAVWCWTSWASCGRCNGSGWATRICGEGPSTAGPLERISPSGFNHLHTSSLI